MCQRKEKLVGIDTFEIEAEPEPKRLTEKNTPCDFVMLSTSNTTGTSGDSFLPGGNPAEWYLEDDYEVYWGFNNKPFHQLFPARHTPLIPVNDAGDIFVRSSAKVTGGERKIAVSIFKYVSEENTDECSICKK